MAVLRLVKGWLAGRPSFAAFKSFRLRVLTGRFGILLDVANKVRDAIPKYIRIGAFLPLGLLGVALACAGLTFSSSTGAAGSWESGAPGQQPAPAATPQAPASTCPP